MAPPRKNTSQAPAAAPATSKGKKGKLLKSSKPANHHPNLSDVHITDAEDSQSSYTLPQRAHTAVLEPRHTNEQLLQMLSSLQKHMEE